MSSPPPLRSQRPAAPLNYSARRRVQPTPPNSSAARRISSSARWRIPQLLGLATGTVLIWYGVSVYCGYRNDVKLAATLEVPDDVSDRYNRLAPKFDSGLSNAEWWLGIDKRRRELCSKAQGHVLEVSAGTGRNSKYLPLMNGVKSVTLADKSQEMIYEARRKWPEEGNAWFIRTSFRVQDCRQKIPCPTPQGFDTVLQTMGLCSTGEPEGLLRNMSEMVNPENGRILLLEHGRSDMEWLNRLMDKIAPAHADRYGCWFNKDIGAIVEKSGLEVVEHKRFNFGTVWWFELRPKKCDNVILGKNEHPVEEERSWLTFLGLRHR